MSISYVSGELTVGELEHSSQELLCLVFVLKIGHPMKKYHDLMEEVKGEKRERSLAIINLL